MNTGILDPGVGQPATRRVAYVYDPYNRLVTRTLDPDGDGPAAATVANYIHDGHQIVLEFDGSEAADLAHRYLWGPAVDQILADEQVTSPGTPGSVLWPLADNLGTVRDLAQYDSQTDATTVANHRVYDAFGELQSETNPAVDHLFAYTARLFDDATGLQWNLNRWYDPAVGRWLSRDPIGFEAGDANLYRYVGNQSLWATDPGGLEALSPAMYEEYAEYMQWMAATATGMGGPAPPGPGWGDWFWDGISTLPRDTWLMLKYPVAIQIGTTLGAGQGLLNTANGFTQLGTALVNSEFDRWNSTMGLLGAPTLAHISLGDWSEGLLVHEDPTLHEISKWSGVVGVSAAIAALISSTLVARLPTGANTCFVAGTGVMVPTEETPAALAADFQEDPASTGWSVVVAGAIAVAGVVGCDANRRRAEREARRRLNGAIWDGFDSAGDGGEESPAAASGTATEPAGRSSDGLPPLVAAECYAALDAACQTAVAESSSAVRWQGSTPAAEPATTAPSPGRAPQRHASPRRQVGRWWLAACLLVAAAFAASGLGTPPSSRSTLSNRPPAAVQSQTALRSIETIRVGQRVIASNPEVADAERTTDTAVDPKTWRKLRLYAEDRWPDGTLDTIEVETLQPPEWVAEHRAQVSATVPLPLDLTEMGLPGSLRATVIANEPCPPLAPGPGKVVLTTVNHLNGYVFELTLADEHGQHEVVRPTGFHKFFSDSRRAWVSTEDLRDGERLPGISGELRVVRLTRLPGVHRVYNINVEGEHVYHVCALGAVAHNNGCDLFGNFGGDGARTPAPIDFKPPPPPEAAPPPGILGKPSSTQWNPVKPPASGIDYPLQGEVPSPTPLPPNRPGWWPPPAASG